MRKLIVTQNITLDGVIEATEGWFSPSEDKTDTSDLKAAVRKHMKTQDALLLGRNTFESFRGYWPKQTDDTTGVTAHLNQVSKYVVSSTLKDPEWENTTVLRGNLAEEVRALKNQPGGEIGVTGSITLVRDLDPFDEEGHRWVEVVPKGSDVPLILAYGFGHWSPEKVGGYTGLIFSVEDMASTYEDLKAKGVTFVSEPEGSPYGIFAEARDPDGNTFVLHDSAQTAEGNT